MYWYAVNTVLWSYSKSSSRDLFFPLHNSPCYIYSISLGGGPLSNPFIYHPYPFKITLSSDILINVQAVICNVYTVTLVAVCIIYFVKWLHCEGHSVYTISILGYNIWFFVYSSGISSSVQSFFSWKYFYTWYGNHHHQYPISLFPGDWGKLIHVENENRGTHTVYPLQWTRFTFTPQLKPIQFTAHLHKRYIN